jgi:hypothetical protein
MIGVGAVGSGTPRYQWRLNGNHLLNETNQWVAISDATPEQAGVYDVIVSNEFGSLTSAGAPLTVNLPLPEIYGALNTTGVPSFTVWGNAGSSVVVEASTNLVNWSAIGTNQMSIALWHFEDTEWFNYQSRYYRVRY